MRRLMTLSLMLTALAATVARADEAPRFVVFEGFMSSGCSLCEAAAPIVDQLALEYADKPVLFIESPVATPPGDRISRWWAAWGTASSPSFPYDMVGSGHGYASGFDTALLYHDSRRTLLDAELARPPQARIIAYFRRVNDKIRTYITITNLGTTTLSFSTNAAKVHALVFEAAKIGLTGRYLRSAPNQGLTTPLAPNATTSLTLDTGNLSPLDWGKLHSVVAVDYQPNGNQAAYDMLQAAAATAPTFSVSPATVSLTVPASDANPRTFDVSFSGPHVLNWSATSDSAWLTVSPTGGPVATPATLTVTPAGLTGGTYTGTVTISASSFDGMAFESTITVTLLRGASPEARFFGIASTQGQVNTVWRSEAVLHNATATPQNVRLELTPRGSSASSAATTMTLTPGETRHVADLYAALSVPSGVGALRVVGDALTWVRTFNQATSGTFGQDVVDGTREGMPPGQTTLFPIHAGADITQAPRSNLLLQNMETGPVEVMLARGGASHATTVPGNAYVQLDNIGQTLGMTSGVGILEVSTTGRVAASLSTVDPTSGDPTTVRGLASTAAGGHVFPGVARLTGENGTQWRSEVILYNPGTGSTDVLLELTPRGVGTVTVSKTVTLAAREVRLIADLFAEMAAPDGAASLGLSGNALAWVRTYNQTTAGTYGQDVVSSATSFAAGEVVRFPVRTPASLTTDFRSNLLLQNLSATTLTVTVSSGNASITSTLPASAYVSLDRIGARLGLSPGAAVIEVSAPGGWTGYVSTVDPVTGDPTTVRGMVATQGDS
jgi:thiol-disulfide isomerase/thioredoxin